MRYIMSIKCQVPFLSTADLLNNFLCALFILYARRFSTSQVADGLMVFEDFFYVICKIRINFRQPLGEVFMHRAFGNPEFFCDHADCFSCLHDIPSYLDGSLFDVIVHTTRLPKMDVRDAIETSMNKLRDKFCCHLRLISIASIPLFPPQP